MLDKRTKGLLTLHGFIIMLYLPCLFLLLAFVGVEVIGRMEYSFINFPLYLLGSVVAGALFFNFYSVLGPTLTMRDRARVAKVSNLQIMVLALIFFGIIYATKDKSLSRIFVGVYLTAAYASFMVLNLFLPRILSRFVFEGKNARVCLVVGNSNSLPQVEPWLRGKERLGLNIVGLLNFGEEDPAEISIPILGIISQMESVIREHGVNQVILLETRHSKKWVQEILKTCEKEGCQVMIYNPWADYFEHPLISVREGPYTFFMFREEPLESPVNRLLKRLLDISIALPVVLFVLPVMIPVVWFFQRKESAGPIFFAQKRRGFNRKEFVLYKFRSMHYMSEAADESKQAERNDERTYHFGAFMRRTSLDEFPQFINVLKGDMSIVGPRPHLPEHDIIFSKEVQIYPQRHFVKPGITGLAQCKGYRGEITDVELLRRRVQYDLEYISDWSLWMDLEVIVQTALIVVNPPETAY